MQWMALLVSLQRSLGSISNQVVFASLQATFRQKHIKTELLKAEMSFLSVLTFTQTTENAVVCMPDQ